MQFSEYNSGPVSFKVPLPAESSPDYTHFNSALRQAASVRPLLVVLPTPGNHPSDPFP